MRERIAQALSDAINAKDKRRTCTLRLIQAAISDRDIANRTQGRDRVSDEAIMAILEKMVQQRDESARGFEEASRLESAEQEREEQAIIREFMPRQLDEENTKRAVADVIAQVDAHGLRDMGRCMNALKQKFPGQLDVAKTSGFVKTMLQ